MEQEKKFLFCLKGTFLVSLIWSILFLLYLPLQFEIAHRLKILDNSVQNFSIEKLIGSGILLLITLVIVRSFSILINRSRKAGKDFITKKLTKNPEKQKEELEDNKKVSAFDKFWDFIAERLVVDNINIHATGSWKYIGIAFFLMIWYMFGDEPFETESNIVLILLIILFFHEAYRSIYVPGGIAGLSYSFIASCLLIYSLYQDYKNFYMILVVLISYLILLVMTGYSRKIFMKIEKQNLESQSR